MEVGQDTVQRLECIPWTLLTQPIFSNSLILILTPYILNLTISSELEIEESINFPIINNL